MPAISFTGLQPLGVQANATNTAVTSQALRMDILLHLWDDFTANANANPIGYLLLVAGAEFAGDVVQDLGWVVSGVAVIRLAGVDPSSMVTTSAVITAIIAFSMQDTLGNVLGGLFLELDDSLSIGDWVRVDVNEPWLPALCLALLAA